jgi:hypothetical protein
MARAPVQAGDAGSSPAPVANLQEERRRLGAMISYGRPKLAELSARLERVRPRGLPFPKDNARGRASTIGVGRP